MIISFLIYSYIVSLTSLLRQHCYDDFCINKIMAFGFQKQGF